MANEALIEKATCMMPRYGEALMLKSSQKVFDVLEFLCANGPHKALEISTQLDLQKSSVHRFLNSLVEFGYVRKDERTGLFGATLKIVQLGAMVAGKIDMAELVRPHMVQLLKLFPRMLCSFGTLMDNQVIVLRREYSSNALTHVDLSQQLPAYCTGLGKALLSVQPDEVIDTYIQTIPRLAYTDRTLVDGKALKQVLLAARRNGYAEDCGEISDAVHCVAVPMQSPVGGVWAISLSSSYATVQGYGAEQLASVLKQVVVDILSPSANSAAGS